MHLSARHQEVRARRARQREEQLASLTQGKSAKYNTMTTSEKQTHSARGRERARGRAAARFAREKKREQDAAMEEIASRKGVGRDPERTSFECAARVAERQKGELKKNDTIRKKAEVDRIRSNAVRESGPIESRKRLLEAKKRKDKKFTRDVARLVNRQTSSREAIIVEKLISPRFDISKNTRRLKPFIKPHSVEEKRIEAILSNDRVGSFYN